MKNGDDRRVVEARPVRDPSRPWVNPPARGAGPDADQEDFALREWLRCSFEMCKSDRDPRPRGGARGGAGADPPGGGGGEDAGMGLGE